MRVALVLAGPFPAFRGSQVLVRQLEDGLRARGHRIHLVTYGAGADELPGPHLARVWRDAWLTFRLWRAVVRHRIEVIHAHNYEAALAGLIVARLTRRPLVYHGHNALAAELPTYFRAAPVRRLAAWVGRLLDAHVPRRADFCIAVSRELGDILRRQGVGADDLACIAPPPSEVGEPPRPAAGSTGLVCYAGNLDGYQNLDFLARSFARVRARVPAARLVLVTHGDAPGDAMRHGREGRVASTWGPGVEIVRAGSYDEVRERLTAADVAVCPRAERSGFPMKLLNYMATGKAIVACAGSAKGLVEGLTARVVPDDDEVAFADAIVALLDDRAARERLGAAARRAVEDPTAWDRVLDDIEAIYRRVTGSPSDEVTQGAAAPARGSGRRLAARPLAETE